MIAGIVIAFIFGWKLALFVLATLPILGIISAINVRLQCPGNDREQKLLEDTGKVAAEAIENIRTVQALTREDTFYNQFCENLVVPHELNLRRAHIHAGGYAFTNSCIFFLFAAYYRFGAYLVTIGDIQPLNVFQ